MALENEQELQQAMADLARSMQGLGTDTANADNSLTKLAKTTSSVAGAMGGTASEIMRGGGAFKSLNGAIDLATKALGGIVGAMPLIGGAAKQFANGVGEAAKFVMNQLDDLAKNYNELGDAGALAADGIDGIQRQFRQMGLVSLPTFTRALGQNSQGMIALGGSMSGAAEEFSKISGRLTDADMGGMFARLGMSFDQVGESAGKYVGALGRYGMTQGKTFEQLAQSTASYIQEVDAIARITGASRKQQEDEQQKSLADVRFRAKIADMIDKGQVEEANRLQTYVNGLTGAAADAARAMATGIPMTQEAAQANMLSRDAIRQNVKAVQDGKDAARAVTDTQKGLAEGAKTFRSQLMYGGETFGNVAIQALDAEAIVKRRAELEAKGIDPVEAARQAQAELISSKGATGAFANAQVAVAGSAKDLQMLSFNLVKNVVPAVDAFAGAIKRVTGFIDKKLGGAPEAGVGRGRGAAGVPVPAEAEGKKVVASEEARKKAEAYLGKAMSDQEFSALIKATHAEAGAGKGASQQEQAMIMASILNRARTDPGGVMGALYAKNQFQSVTGTAADGHRASKQFLEGPGKDRLQSIEGATAMLDRVVKTQKDFTAASAAAYGPGTNIGYRDTMLRTGGQVVGGSVFRTAMLPEGSAVPAGPTQNYKETVSKVNPTTTLPQTSPGEATTRLSAQERANEQMTAIFAGFGAKLDELVRVNQRQLAVGERQLKVTAS